MCENAYMNAITTAINSAVSASSEGRERIKALKAVRWVLRSGSMFVGPVNADLESTLVDNRKDALVFDGRDNEQMRAKFFSAYFSAPFTPELI